MLGSSAVGCVVSVTMSVAACGPDPVLDEQRTGGTETIAEFIREVEATSPPDASSTGH